MLVQIVSSLFQKHLEVCGYVPIPCPNECSDILLRKDLPHHLSQICTKRKIVCCKCGEQVTAEREQVIDRKSDNRETISKLLNRSCDSGKRTGN